MPAVSTQSLTEVDTGNLGRQSLAGTSETGTQCWYLKANSFALEKVVIRVIRGSGQYCLVETYWPGFSGRAEKPLKLPTATAQSAVLCSDRTQRFSRLVSNLEKCFLPVIALLCSFPNDSSHKGLFNLYWKSEKKTNMILVFLIFLCLKVLLVLIQNPQAIWDWTGQTESLVSEAADRMRTVRWSSSVYCVQRWHYRFPNLPFHSRQHPNWDHKINVTEEIPDISGKTQPEVWEARDKMLVISEVGQVG